MGLIKAKIQMQATIECRAKTWTYKILCNNICSRHKWTRISTCRL